MDPSLRWGDEGNRRARWLELQFSDSEKLFRTVLIAVARVERLVGGQRDQHRFEHVIEHGSMRPLISRL